MVLPWASVMVIIVLLNVALTCAVPAVMFLRSRRRGRAAGAAADCCLAIGKIALVLLLGDLLLAGDGARPALAGSRVGMCALAADREALAVPQPAIAAEVHEALDVHRHFAAQVALDRVAAVDLLAD